MSQKKKYELINGLCGLAMMIGMFVGDDVVNI